LLVLGPTKELAAQVSGGWRACKASSEQYVINGACVRLTVSSCKQCCSLCVVFPGLRVYFQLQTIACCVLC
jgi:hypothetical protein